VKERDWYMYADLFPVDLICPKELRIMNEEL
jgi:hypothetical protein